LDKEQILEKTYGFVLPTPSVDNRENSTLPGSDDELRPPTPHELLQTFAAFRGFTTIAGGLPNEAQAAKILLKDYVNVLLFESIQL
jgi:ribosome biogenesis GTPase A